MIKGLTTTEAAERLSISPARVRRLVLDGRLSAEKFGRDLVIKESDVEAFQRLKGGRPPKPTLGRPPKPKEETEKSAAKKRVRKRTKQERQLKMLS